MGRNLPAAFIPFCSYQGERAILGLNMEGFNIVCDKFKPTIMEGQLCYSLDVKNITRTKSKAGRGMGLTLLLDRINPRTGIDPNFRIFLNTLDGFSDMKDGSYRMINVKKLVGTDSFMALPDEDRGCQEKTLHDCSAQLFLERIKQSCECVPWDLKNVLRVGLFLILGVFSTQCSIMARLHAGVHFVLLHTHCTMCLSPLKGVN